MTTTQSTGQTSGEHIPATAHWRIELHTTCPTCHRKFDALKHAPELSARTVRGDLENVPIECPLCQADFAIDINW